MIYVFASFGLITGCYIAFEAIAVLRQKIKERKTILPVKFVEFAELEMVVCQHCQQCITGYKPDEREIKIAVRKQERYCPMCGKRIRWV